MHALIFFTCNHNIAAKMKTLSFNSLAPNTRFERLTYDSKYQFCELQFDRITTSLKVRPLTTPPPPPPRSISSVIPDSL